MKYLNRAYMLGLISFALCIQCNVSAANKESTLNDYQLQQAYKLLVINKKQGQHKAQQKIASSRSQVGYGATHAAKKQINKKYRWGGSSPHGGFDCSGLMQYAFKSVRVNLPRTAAAQYRYTKRVSLADLQVGDLIFFHTRRTRARVNHVGMYLGGNKFIHAPRKGKRVSVASLNRYWRKKYVGAGRV